MASAQDLRKRIKSVTNTQQITKAMKMVASARLRRAQTKAEATRPYAEKIGQILRHMSNSDLEGFESPLLDVRPVERTCYIVVGADKGLAGAYNHNVLKMAEELIGQPGKHKMFVLGEVGRQYFSRREDELDSEFKYTVQSPNLYRARVIAIKMVELFEQEELDDIYIIYTRMKNALQAETQQIKLLPLQRINFASDKMAAMAGVYREAVTLYPSAHKVMDSIVTNYLIGIIYGCLVESYCSEQNSRMQAMQNATDSATDMLNELNITYNRVRQADITQELTEVIGGANAQKRK